MNKPVWTWTHTGEQGEELCCIDNMYFTKFAWDHFLAAYTGKVRSAHRDRPPAQEWTGTSNWWHTPEVADFLAGDDGNVWPADEKTDPMPQTVISPRQLTPAQKLKKLDPTGKFGYWLDDSMGLTVESMSSGASATIDYSVLESLRELFTCNDMPSAVALATDIHEALSSIDSSMQPEEAAHIIKAWNVLAPGSKKKP